MHQPGERRPQRPGVLLQATQPAPHRRQRSPAAAPIRRQPAPPAGPAAPPRSPRPHPAAVPASRPAAAHASPGTPRPCTAPAAGPRRPSRRPAPSRSHEPSAAPPGHRPGAATAAPPSRARPAPRPRTAAHQLAIPQLPLDQIPIRGYRQHWCHTPCTTRRPSRTLPKRSGRAVSPTGRPGPTVATPARASPDRRAKIVLTIGGRGTPIRPRRRRRLTTCPDDRYRRVRVTHRFHPQSGPDFDFVAHRRNRGEDRVRLRDENSGLFWPAWRVDRGRACRSLRGYRGGVLPVHHRWPAGAG